VGQRNHVLAWGAGSLRTEGAILEGTSPSSLQKQGTLGVWLIFSTLFGRWQQQCSICSDLLSLVVQKSVENVNKGVDYMLMAADAGDRSAMLYMAKAYETGIGLGENR